MAKCIGYWKLESTDEHWDAYMKAVGIGFALRQIGKRTTSWEDIKQEGEQWFISITSTFKNMYLQFVMGQEFDAKTMDGRSVKYTCHIEGDKLVLNEKQMKDGLPDSVITRERIDDNTMTVTFDVIDKGVRSVMRYIRLEKDI